MQVNVQINDYETSIQNRIKSGNYATASEILRAGLRALDIQDARTIALNKLKGIIQESIDSGDVYNDDGTPKTCNQITDEWLASKGLSR